jgi:hypothetical protein
MSIAVSVQNWKFTARHNSGGVRQESAPQSANAYSFEPFCLDLKPMITKTSYQKMILNSRKLINRKTKKNILCRKNYFEQLNLTTSKK